MHDEGTGTIATPVPRPQRGGWGLYFVERLADSWGVADDDSRVWFRVGALSQPPDGQPVEHARPLAGGGTAEHDQPGVPDPAPAQEARRGGQVGRPLARVIGVEQDRRAVGARRPEPG